VNEAYSFINHTYDVIVVGAGGAGLRSALGMSAAGLKTCMDLPANARKK